MTDLPSTAQVIRMTAPRPRAEAMPVLAAAGLLVLGLAGCAGGAAESGSASAAGGGEATGGVSSGSASDAASSGTAVDPSAGASAGSASSPASDPARPTTAEADPTTAERWPLLAAAGVRADGESGPAVEVTDREDPDAEGRLAVGQVPGLIWLATESSEGHGVVIGRDGLVLTAHHVIAGAGELRAAVPVGSRLEEREVEVLGGDRTADVAVLRLTDGAPGGVPRLDPSLHQWLDELASVGWFLGDSGPSAVRGPVVGLHEEVTVHDTPAMDGEGTDLDGLTAVEGEAPPGFSGGPAVDDAGAVAGLAVAASEGVTLVRPLHDALDVAEQVLSGQETDTVTLGRP